ncbi:MAG: helix-turn-helix transcriptional regulator [Dehalococcoidales bacterium]|nr:helix-turn-helix transcriptional regulator [Dehalococcoidales bacterium]
MTKQQKFVLQTHEDVLNYFLKDPEIKKAYDDLEPEYQVKRALIELRIKNEQTQKKLADKLNTKQAYISRVERGSVSPTVTYIAKMADALNADAEIIFRPRGSKDIIKAVLVKEKKRKYKAK